jgi:formate hydrogenlyase subunit 4
MLQSLLLQVLAVLVVLLCAPLLHGVINRLKAIIQSKRVPSIWQPYCDYRKLLWKGSVVSEHATWVYRFAPPLVFITPLVVSMLTPVITAYPLLYAFMGNMLASGFILSLGGFFISVAALDTGSAFGRILLNNPSNSFVELPAIESSRLIEYSGSDLALMEWGSAMRFFVLLTILLNVLTAP